jgi:hypothetical protein
VFAPVCSEAENAVKSQRYSLCFEWGDYFGMMESTAYNVFLIVILLVWAILWAMTRRKRDREYSRRPEERIADTLEEIEIILFDGLRLLQDRLPQRAKSLVVKIGGKTVNQVLSVGQTAQATAHEFSGPNGTGSELPLAGAISWVSDDPTVATVDPASGLVTAVAASKLDASNQPIPVNITATDAANNLSGSSSVTDQPLTAQSLTVTITPN